MLAIIVSQNSSSPLTACLKIEILSVEVCPIFAFYKILWGLNQAANHLDLDGLSAWLKKIPLLFNSELCVHSTRSLPGLGSGSYWHCILETKNNITIYLLCNGRIEFIPPRNFPRSEFIFISFFLSERVWIDLTHSALPWPSSSIQTYILLFLLAFRLFRGNSIPASPLQAPVRTR